MRSEADQHAVASILQRDFGMPSFFLTIASSAPVRTAVVTAAGFGRRMFPATKACRAELFPIVGADGVAKPALVHTLQQLVAGGIERILVVVQPRDLALFRDLLTERVPPAQYHRLSPAARRYADELQELGRRVAFAVQERQEGLAHAVLAARSLVGDEPFLLALGDHLFMQNDGPAAAEASAEATAAVGGPGEGTAPGAGASCVSQMLRQYQRMGGTGALVGLQLSTAEEASSYGTYTGTWIDGSDGERKVAATVTGGEADAAALPVAASAAGSSGGRYLLSISEVAEKPSPEYAREHLRLPSPRLSVASAGTEAGAAATATAPDSQCATSFGLFVLPTSVFAAVDDMVAHNLRGSSGDFELGTALEQLRRSQGLTGLVVAGQRFDLASPEHFVQAVSAFAAQRPGLAAAAAKA